MLRSRTPGTPNAGRHYSTIPMPGNTRIAHPGPSRGGAVHFRTNEMSGTISKEGRYARPPHRQAIVPGASPTDLEHLPQVGQAASDGAAGDSAAKERIEDPIDHPARFIGPEYLESSTTNTS